MFASCLTVRRIQGHCGDFARVCGETTIAETKYRDTVVMVDRRVPIFLTRDTARIDGLVKVTAKGAQMAPVTQTHGIVTVRAQVIDSQLQTVAYINRDSIVASVTDSIRLHNAIVDRQTEKTVPVRVKYIPKFYRFAFWTVIAEMAGVVLCIVFKVLNIFRVKL